jgi:hypothetical protein
MADKTAAKTRKSPDRKRNEASLANLRLGGGRPKGVPNKATLSLKELAREYTPQALETLAHIMLKSESDTARVSAANAILDRGYGKPSTVLAGDEDGNPVKMVHEIILRGIASQ